MHHDITHKGKVYRIILEGPNAGHPCEALAILFDVSNKKTPKEIYREVGFEQRELAKLEQGVRAFLKNI